MQLTAYLPYFSFDSKITSKYLSSYSSDFKFGLEGIGHLPLGNSPIQTAAQHLVLEHVYIEGVYLERVPAFGSQWPPSLSYSILGVVCSTFPPCYLLISRVMMLDSRLCTSPNWEALPLLFPLDTGQHHGSQTGNYAIVVLHTI